MSKALASLVGLLALFLGATVSTQSKRLKDIEVVPRDDHSVIKRLNFS
jgi:hypothetical protein